MRSPGTRLSWLWGGTVLAPLMVRRSSTAAMLAAAAGFAVLVLVLLVVVVALGSAFARSAERRRACLHTLQALLRLAPWTARRDGGATDSGSEVTDIEMEIGADNEPRILRRR